MAVGKFFHTHKKERYVSNARELRIHTHVCVKRDTHNNGLNSLPGKNRPH